MADGERSSMRWRWLWFSHVDPAWGLSPQQRRDLYRVARGDSSWWWIPLFVPVVFYALSNAALWAPRWLGLNPRASIWWFAAGLPMLWLGCAAFDLVFRRPVIARAHDVLLGDRCGNCGYALNRRDERSRCSECGVSPVELKCARCRAWMPMLRSRRWRFCMECGHHSTNRAPDSTLEPKP